MSLRWRSELRLDLRRGGCDAHLAAGWLAGHPDVRLSAEGSPGDAIASVLESLRQSVATRLPRTASLTVPDEYVYYALTPASEPWSRRHAAAVEHFAETLGRRELSVQSALVASGRAWLLASVEAQHHATWKQACDDAGIELAHLYPALLQDLRRVAHRVPDDAIVVVVRDEGAVLIRIANGAIDELRWERCTLDEIAARVLAFERTTARADARVPVLFVSQPSVDGEAIERLAIAHGWQDVGICASPTDGASS